MKLNIQHLLDGQLKDWELARNNYAALSSVRTKEFVVNDCIYKVQFNPARLVSSAAKVDKQSIKERKCFLCQINLPTQQLGLSFGEHYQVLVNPFPIFPKHLTIPDIQHVDQLIHLRMGDMLNLAEAAPDYVLFYNGPKCGASAPDHMHFQAGNKGFLPFEKEWKKKRGEVIIKEQHAMLSLMNDDLRTAFLIESTDKQEVINLFDKLYHALDLKEDETEPMLNLLTWKENDAWIIAIFPRYLHRPSCYTAEGEENLLISPASVDMGGVMITPLEKDFNKISEKEIATILREVCLPMEKCKEVVKKLKIAV